jgi:muconolactone delta-isomerase
MKPVMASAQAAVAIQPCEKFEGNGLLSTGFWREIFRRVSSLQLNTLFKNPDEENPTEIEVIDPTHPLFPHDAQRADHVDLKKLHRLAQCASAMEREKEDLDLLEAGKQGSDCWMRINFLHSGGRQNRKAMMDTSHYFFC